MGLLTIKTKLSQSYQRPDQLRTGFLKLARICYWRECSSIQVQVTRWKYSRAICWMAFNIPWNQNIDSVCYWGFLAISRNTQVYLRGMQGAVGSCLNYYIWYIWLSVADFISIGNNSNALWIYRNSLFLKAKGFFLSRGAIKVEIKSQSLSQEGVLMLGDEIERTIRPYLLSVNCFCLFIVQIISTELPSSYSTYMSIFIAGVVTATDVLLQWSLKDIFRFFCVFLVLKNTYR